MDTTEHKETPFDEAWRYIADNDGGAAEDLAKLCLAFWDHYNHPYTLAECLPPLDSVRRHIAKGMIDHYFDHGADASVRRHAKDILAKYPKFKRRKRDADPAREEKDHIAELVWKLKRISDSLGTAIAHHDFDTAHAEAGRFADALEHYEKTRPAHSV